MTITGSIRKSLALIPFLILAISSLSLMMTKPSFAQIVTPPVPLPTPSVPQFTVKFVGPSYAINSTYYVEYGTLEIIIKNQPFTPETIQGNNATLYYNVQSKLHSATEWTNWFQTSDYDYPNQNSSSEYTILSYSWDGSQIFTNTRGVEIPSSSQVDFQVQAMFGYITRIITPGVALPPWYFVGEASGWSNTQTITAGTEISYTPSPSLSTSTPTSMPVSSASRASPSLTTIIALAVVAVLVLVIISLSVLLYRMNRKIASLANKINPTKTGD